MYETHTIVGYVGNKPQLRLLSDGTAVTNINVAVNRRWTDNNGQQQERTTWYRVACWRKLGEVVSKYVDKGKLVLVTGNQLQTSTYTAQDGSTRATLELTADTVRFLSGPDESGDADDDLPI